MRKSVFAILSFLSLSFFSPSTFAADEVKKALSIKESVEVLKKLYSDVAQTEVYLFQLRTRLISSTTVIGPFADEINAFTLDEVALEHQAMMEKLLELNDDLADLTYTIYANLTRKKNFFALQSIKEAFEDALTEIKSARTLRALILRQELSEAELKAEKDLDHKRVIEEYIEATKEAIKRTTEIIESGTKKLIKLSTPDLLTT